MTLVGVWRGDEGRLWMASDSRLHDGSSTMINEAVKLFEVPMRCVAGGPLGGPEHGVYYRATLGLACAGSSLTFGQLQSNLVSLLGHVLDPGRRVPTMLDVASYAARVGTVYLRSYGSSAGHAVVVLAGWCPTESRLLAYELRPELVDGTYEFVAKRLALDVPHFFGDQPQQASLLYDQLVLGVDSAVERERVPLSVLRHYIEDPDAGTVGGDLQVGFSVGQDFWRVATVRPPAPGGEPFAEYWLNAIAIDEFRTLGPCLIAIPAITVS